MYLMQERNIAVSVDQVYSRVSHKESVLPRAMGPCLFRSNCDAQADRILCLDVQGQISPLTEYFFWPRKDAWDELRMSLEARPWISER